jgi:hypothetical protein
MFEGICDMLAIFLWSFDPKLVAKLLVETMNSHLSRYAPNVAGEFFQTQL